MVSRSGYATTNGLQMYYDVHGTGPNPLVVLHGGAATGEVFGDLLPALAERHQVVAPDLQAHGRTADIDRPLRYEVMADDVVGLIRSLRLGKTDLLGYSLGGGVALWVAFQRPELVRRLVVVSTAFRRDGWYPEVQDAMGRIGLEASRALEESPMYKTYAKVAPQPTNWPILISKLGALLRRDYDWSNEVSKVKVPTMVVAGDADSVRTSHATEFFELLGGGKRDGGWDGSGISTARLAILPGVTHYNICSSQALAAAVGSFLDESVL